MSGRLVTIRGAVFDTIKDKKSDRGFCFNNFEVDWHWKPETAIPDMPADGKVWVVASSPGDVEIITRAKSAQQELAVQVAFQKVIDITDREKVDTLIDFMEELQDVCRKEVTSSPCLRIVPLQNDEGKDLPFFSVGLRKASIFETYFTAYYKTAYQ